MNVDKLKCCTPHLVFKVLNLRHFNASKSLVMLLLIAMLIGYTLVSRPTAAASGDVVLSINPSIQAVGEGDTFNVSIMVDNIPSPKRGRRFRIRPPMGSLDSNGNRHHRCTRSASGGSTLSEGIDCSQVALTQLTAHRRRR
jgi:hypothetical protein